jgi:hypothetical protein
MQIAFVVLLLIAASTVSGQTAVVPQVTLNNTASSFQASIYPDWYRVNSAAADMRWVARNDSLIQIVWQTQGDSILARLSLLAGINWVEKGFPIYLVRYFPSVGESDPMIIPLGGELNGLAIEAPPSGPSMVFNLIYQLSLRLLGQTQLSTTDAPSQVVNHPLLQPGPYRRENLAMLLSLAVATTSIGTELTLEVYNSPFWRSQAVGRQIFEEQFQKKWVITPQKPLAQWLKEEPYDSPLVEMTRPPQLTADDGTDTQVTAMAGLPPKGTLGFTVKSGTSGRFEIDKVDPGRLGGICGLRAGDAISQVDGRRPANIRELFERILAGLERGGSTLSVFRGGKLTTIIVRRK